MAYLGVKPAAITSATEAEIAGDLTVDTNTLHVDASSDVVRVGKTSGGVTTDGWRYLLVTSHYAIPSGQYFILNRTTSGAATMIDFRSENSSKGGITYNGTNVSFTSGSNNVFNQAGISFDNGTNYLEDYEEGTWTPSVGGSATYTLQVGHYTKIGNQVFITGIILINSISGADHTNYAWMDCHITVSQAVVERATLAFSILITLPQAEHILRYAQMATDFMVAAKMQMMSAGDVHEPHYFPKFH